jgi:hypothetical protein
MVQRQRGPYERQQREHCSQDGPGVATLQEHRPNIRSGCADRQSGSAYTVKQPGPQDPRGTGRERKA